MIGGISIISVAIFTDWIYEGGIALILGVFLLLIGLWLWKRGATKEKAQTQQRFQRFRGWGEKWKQASDARARAGQAARERRKILKTEMESGETTSERIREQKRKQEIAKKIAQRRMAEAENLRMENEELNKK